MYYGRSKSNFPVARLEKNEKRLWEHVFIDHFMKFINSQSNKKKNPNNFSSQRRDKGHRQTHISTQANSTER